MTNAETSPCVAGSAWPFRLPPSVAELLRRTGCHSFVISASSLVIPLLILAIRAYRWTISPAQTFLFGPTGGCRFTPTCSQYAMDAIRAQGAMAGGWLAVKRICRCHPWGRCGHDPVPKQKFVIRHSSFDI